MRSKAGRGVSRLIGPDSRSAATRIPVADHLYVYFYDDRLLNVCISAIAIPRALL